MGRTAAVAAVGIRIVEVELAVVRNSELVAVAGTAALEGLVDIAAA